MPKTVQVTVTASSINERYGQIEPGQRTLPVELADHLVAIGNAQPYEKKIQPAAAPKEQRPPVEKTEQPEKPAATNKQAKQSRQKNKKP